MNIIRKHHLLFLGILLMLAGIIAACSSDSPTTPKQEGAPPPGTTPPNATWNISVTASPTSIQPAGSGNDFSEITIRVTNAADGTNPPADTLIQVSTSLGSFSRSSTITSGSVTLVGGAGRLTLYADSDSGAGNAVVEARLEQSRGSAVVKIAALEGAFISHLEPAVGRPEGGYTVNIVGGGFYAEATATFGGMPAEVLGVSPDSVRVRVPGISLATGDTEVVTVGLTIGQGSESPESLSLASGFTYAHGGTAFAPQIFSISPTQGPNEGGYEAVIRGANFTSPSQVLFGLSEPLAEATIVSLRSNEIVVVVPSATGFGQSNENQTVNVTVRSLNTGLVGVMQRAFAYGGGGGTDPMFISSISPTQGPKTGGTIVTIFGFGFDEPVAVDIGGFGQQVISVTGSEIVIRTVEPDTGTCGDTSGPVHVRNIETLEEADGPDYTFIGDDPIVLGVTPASGPEVGGNAATVFGQGFVAPAVVFFGDSTALLTTVISLTETSVVVPRFTGTLRTEPCDDNNDGTVGERSLPTSVVVSWENEALGCSDDLEGGYTYTPADSSCRNDVGAGTDTPPIADFTWSPNPQAGVAVSFTNASTPGSSPIIVWRWDFGDGTPPVFGQGPQLHSFAAAGNYSVVLQVTDSASQSSSITQTVAVGP